MKNLIFAIILLCGNHLLFAQKIDSLNAQEIAAIKNDISDQNQKIDTLIEIIAISQNKIDFLNREIDKQGSKLISQNRLINNNNFQLKKILKLADSLSGALSETQLNINKRANALGNKIEKTQENTSSEILKLDLSIEKNKLYWILGSLITIILGGFIYLLLNKKILTSKKSSELQIKNTKKALEEETIKLDNKLIELLNSQLKVSQEESQSNTKDLAQESDHSLALKVADEIIRLEKNLGRMDPDIKGLKQLSASVNRIKDNFASNGYEIIEMLGKEYNEGMKVTANFVPDESLEEGKQIISRIIKPQVNFNDRMIQVAQIEVSIGE